MQDEWAQYNRVLICFLKLSSILGAASTVTCAIAITGLGIPAINGFIPTAFFVFGPIAIATGGLLGFATLTVEPRQVQGRVALCELMGGIALGTEAYGVWCLFHFDPSKKLPNLGEVVVLASTHLLSGVVVLLLAAFAASLFTQLSEPREGRYLLKACCVYWLGLGVCWSLLLCAFAVLL